MGYLAEILDECQRVAKMEENESEKVTELLDKFTPAIGLELQATGVACAEALGKKGLVLGKALTKVQDLYLFYLLDKHSTIPTDWFIDIETLIQTSNLARLDEEAKSVLERYKEENPLPNKKKIPIMLDSPTFSTDKDVENVEFTKVGNVFVTETSDHLIIIKMPTLWRRAVHVRILYGEGGLHRIGSCMTLGVLPGYRDKVTDMWHIPLYRDSDEHTNYLYSEEMLRQPLTVEVANKIIVAK